MTRRLPWFLLGGLAGYGLLRRSGRRGGATDAEVHDSLPGDWVVPHPMIETTHAVTIDAAPSVVWPWLIQAGYRGAGRAGWYADPWLLRVTEGVFLRLTVPARTRAEHRRPGSVEELLPEFQKTTVGDIVPDGPPGTAFFVVKEVQPERAWVLHSDSHVKYLSPTVLHGTSLELDGEFSWVFVLRPIEGARRTRLILRTRGSYGSSPLSHVVPPLFYAGEALIPRLILRGIKRRAEGGRQPTGGEEAGPGTGPAARADRQG